MKAINYRLESVLIKPELDWKRRFLSRLCVGALFAFFSLSGKSGRRSVSRFVK